MFINAITPMEFGETTSQQTINTNSTGLPFASLLTDAIAETNRLQQITEEDSQNILMGNIDNLAQVQINSLKAESMVQTTVQLVSRVVNCYKEIMQMQV
ncbi:MAG: flagellar hook-basal body complex protein FliE [Clostridia bacterium]